MSSHGVPERVCPNCSTITATREQHCPWCGDRYGGRRGGVGVGGLAALLLVHAALVLGGVAYLLTVFGDTLESELDTQVERVERDLDGIVEDVRRELERELDERLPSGGVGGG